MTDDAHPGRPVVIPFEDLEHNAHSHEFVGAELGNVPFSVILVHSAPGVGPAVHTHPYPEVFVVQSGTATFRLGDEDVVVGADHVVVAGTGVPHGFTNSGDDELRLTAIHGAPRFITEWLGAPDKSWVSSPGHRSPAGPS